MSLLSIQVIHKNIVIRNCRSNEVKNIDARAPSSLINRNIVI